MMRSILRFPVLCSVLLLATSCFRRGESDPPPIELGADALPSTQVLIRETVRFERYNRRPYGFPIAEGRAYGFRVHLKDTFGLTAMIAGSPNVEEFVALIGADRERGLALFSVTPVGGRARLSEVYLQGSDRSCAEVVKQVRAPRCGRGDCISFACIDLAH